MAVAGAGNTRIAGAWKNVGTAGIRVAPADPIAPKSGSGVGKAAPIESANVRVLSATAARAYGLKGLALEVKRTDGRAGKAPLAVDVPKSLLSGMYGGDYASRVRWVQTNVPTGSASSAAKTLRGATTVAATADTANKATTLTPTIAAATVLLTAESAPISATGTGSFAATPLNAAKSWDVSAQTGDFSWSYPMRTPPAAAGPAPSLGLSYNSQSVDGETGSTNNQPSSAGDGWEITGGGSITRAYESCAELTGLTGAVATAAAASGDQCWNTDNATLTLDGHSGLLVKDATTGAWHLQDDDGTTIRHLTGSTPPAGVDVGCTNQTYDDDCWVVTTTDGTQYFFGANELPGWTTGKSTTNSTYTVPVYGASAGQPCYSATSFAASSCVQAWQWNLDYVVDTHGNAEALYYDAQTNKYAQDASTTTATTYVRGGALDHIDYGFSNGNAYATDAASDKVVFGYDGNGRCISGCTAEAVSGLIAAPATPANYPDVPFDQECTGTTCPTLLAPTFFSTSMLDTVTTEYLSGTTYSKVDVWTLGHSFPAPGDGTTAALWLAQVAHTGYSYSPTASLSEPTTVFAGTAMQNRVWAVDGLAPLDKYRVTGITTSEGAVITVNYSAQQCTPAGAAAIEASPQTNTARCFPQWWVPSVVPAQAAQLDLFHKYVVTSVVSNPVTGGGADQTQETDYVYTGTPGWRYDNSPLTPAKYRTWDVYAGYNTIEVRVGSPASPSTQQTTDYTFYQGMNGDRATAAGGTKTVNVAPGVPDALPFAGQTYETKVLNGAGGSTPTVSDTITKWMQIGSPTANDGTNTANITGVGTTSTSTPLSTGGNRTTTTTTTYTAAGDPSTVDKSTPDGSTCTTNTYAPANTATGVSGLIQEASTVAVDCPAPSTVAVANAISDVRTSYDGLSLGSTPTKGDVTSTSTVDAYGGTSGTTVSPTWSAPTTTTYDYLGRPLLVTDVLGHTTTTAYTPSATPTAPPAVGSGPLTKEISTNTAPFSWATTTLYNPEWGLETSVTDQNGAATTAAYDSLGRRIDVWLPGRAQATYPSSPSIQYQYTLSTTAPNVIATTTLLPTSSTTEYDLYDGLGQEVQTQKAAEGGGADITDMFYDSAGRTYASNASYWTSSVSPSTALFVPTSESQIPSETVNTFDGDGRTLTSSLVSMGSQVSQTTTAYPGADEVTTTPPAGGTPTSSITNSLGEQTQLIQYLGTTPTGTSETTTYTYNPQGKMATMTDPAGHIWSWGYDVLGHQTSASDPDTGITTSTYDDAGNLLTSTDARNNTIAYSYDALNRKTAEYQGAVGSTGSELASWAYDTLDKGQLDSSSSYVGSTPGTPGAKYTDAVTGYNAAYQVTGSTISIPSTAPAFAGTSYSTTYSYDQDGTQAYQVDPAEGGLPSERVKEAFDTLGNAESLTGSSAIVQDAYYDSLGRPSEYERTSTDDLLTTYGYDTATGNETSIDDTSVIGGTYTNQASRTYAYNLAGGVTSQTTTAASVATDTQCYRYDGLQDLTDVWTPSSNSCTADPTSTTLGGPAAYWDSYTIDPATGNRTATTEHATTGTGTNETDTYSYAATQPNAVQSVTHVQGTSTSTSTYSYDVDGNTTARPGQTLTYDATGKVSTVTAGGVTQQNIYDASGNLLMQTDPTSGTSLFLGDTELHLAAGATAASGTRTYSLNGTPVAERDTVAGVTGTVLLWLGADAQNTVGLEMSPSTGTITRRYTDPYGNSRGTATSWSDDHTYLNAAESALTGLVTLGAREYDATIGKFLSADPLLDPSNPQQVNGYSYANNDPVTESDPTGLKSKSSTLDSILGINRSQTCGPPLIKQCGSSGNDPAPGNTSTNNNSSSSSSSSGSSHYASKRYVSDKPAVKVNAFSQLSCQTDTQACMLKANKAAAKAGPAILMSAFMLAVAAVSVLELLPTGLLDAPAVAAQDVAIAGAVAPEIAADAGGIAADATADGVASAVDEGDEGVLDDTVDTCAANSFAAATLVVLATGVAVAISAITVGEKVLATNPKTGKTTARTVKKVWINHDTDLMNVTVSAGGRSSVIRATQHHPFWDVTLSRWVEADRLIPGDRLESANGVVVTVASTVVVPGAADMWDLTVSTDHDF